MKHFSKILIGLLVTSSFIGCSEETLTQDNAATNSGAAIETNETRGEELNLIPEGFGVSPEINFEEPIVFDLDDYTLDEVLDIVIADLYAGDIPADMSLTADFNIHPGEFVVMTPIIVFNDPTTNRGDDDNYGKRPGAGWTSYAVCQNEESAKTESWKAITTMKANLKAGESMHLQVRRTQLNTTIGGSLTNH